jgi:hypothetical protein
MRKTIREMAEEVGLTLTQACEAAAGASMTLEDFFRFARVWRDATPEARDFMRAHPSMLTREFFMDLEATRRPHKSRV